MHFLDRLGKAEPDINTLILCYLKKSIFELLPRLEQSLNFWLLYEQKRDFEENIVSLLPHVDQALIILKNPD